MENAGRTLADYLTNRLDDQLQAVVTYGADSRTIVFVRSDLHDSISSNAVFEEIDRARECHEDLREVSASDLSTGEARFSVHAFEDTLILHILGSKGGIVVAFEPDAGRGLIEFVNDCLEEIELAPLSVA